MSQSKRVNIHSNFPTSSDDSIVDPKRFVQSLKVEESEEADKREERRRAIQQDELESEYEEAQVKIPIPNGLFKKFMTEEAKRHTIFDEHKDTKFKLKLEDEPTIKDTRVSVGKVDESIDSKIVIESESKSSEPIEGEETTSDAAEEARVAEDVSRPRTKEEIKTTEKEKQPAVEQKEIKHPHEEKSVEIKEPHEQRVEVKEEHPPVKEVKEQKPEAPKETLKEHKAEKKAPAETAKKEEEPLAEQELEKEEGLLSAPVRKEEKKENTVKIKKGEEEDEATLNTSHKTPIEEGSENGDGKNEQEKQEEQAHHTVTASNTMAAAPTHIAPAEMSPFANIPKDVFELYQKLVGIITLGLSEGKSTTRVVLNMPGTVFDKCEIVLDHYDTAPQAFNATFLGNPEAVEKFHKNMKNLNKAFSKDKKKYSIHLLTPKLQENDSQQ